MRKTFASLLAIVALATFLPTATPVYAAPRPAAPALPGGTPAAPAVLPGKVVPPRIRWTPKRLSLTARAGDVTPVQLTFVLTGTLTGLRAKVSGTVGKVLALNIADARATGRTYRIPGRVSIPVTKPKASYSGTVTLYNAGKKLAARLAVKVRTKKPDATTIPATPSDPAPERVSVLNGEQTAVTDELVVRLKGDVKDPSALIRTLARTHRAVIQGASPSMRTYQLRFGVTDIAALAPIRTELAATAGVATVAHNLIFAEQKVPNDPLWDSWTTDRTAGNNWHLKSIDAPAAWDITTGSPAVKVAILDTLVSTGQEDLEPNLSYVESGVEYAPSEHGTEVAGAACAAGNNDIGITGVMWTCDLRSYGEYLISLATMQAHMLGVAKGGASIVNLSFGLHDPTPEDVEEANAIFGEAIQNATDLGLDVLWVASAGNESINAVNQSPAGLAGQFPNVMAVAALDRHGDLASFSNFGSTVSVGAPGVDILTTAKPSCPLFGDCVPRYNTVSGTSLAAPIVSGIAGLVKAAHPSYTASQVKSCIVVWGSATPVSGQPFGAVNARDAVVCEPKPTPLEVATTSLPEGIAGQAYTTVLEASGGTPPYRWAVTDLPTGLTLDAATGEIKGTSADMAFPYMSITVTDAAGASAQKDLRLSIRSGTVGALSAAAAWRHTCAVTQINRVLCWGNNEFGQLGDGTRSNAVRPVEVPDLRDASGVATGKDHTCAVFTNGAVQCWGGYWYGQLGDGRESASGDAASTVPVTVTGLPAAKAVVAGGDGQSCALTATGGDVWCWGVNWSGQLGDTGFTAWDSPVPRQVPGLTGVTALAAGGAQTCAIVAGGVRCWGGQDGASPTAIDELSGAHAVSVNGGHVCAILADDSVRCVGGAWYGDDMDPAPGAVPDPGVQHAVSIAVGGDHACAVISTGGMRCWGRNQYGQLGDGTTSTNRDLVTVSGITDATTVAAGLADTCAVTATKALRCWGENSSGQLGVDDTVDRSTPTTVIKFG
jgi:hypothetical protein